MLILINLRLLNVAFSMTKAIIGQSSPKQNLNSSYLSELLEKLSFCLYLFSSNFFFLFLFSSYLHLSPFQL